jgi:hypothetical protein
LPAAARGAGAAGAEPPEVVLARDYAGVHVLLAEDEPINQLIARELLEEVGLQVSVADNGEQAVGWWRPIPMRWY